MTAKERRELGRLKIKQQETARALDHAHHVTRKLIWENIELRTALAGVRALIHETATIIDTVEIEK